MADYVARIGIDVPSAPRENTGDPLYGTAQRELEQITYIAAQGSAIFARQEEEKDRIDQLTQAESVLTSAQEELVLKGRQFRDPGETPEQIQSFNPRQRASDYAKFGQQLITEANAKGVNIGPHGQKYVSSHIRALVLPHVEKFHNEMDGAWREADNFKFTQSVEDFKTQAIMAPDQATMNDITNRFREQLGARVGAGLLKDNEAAAIFNTTRNEIFLDRRVARIRQDPTTYTEDYLRSASDMGMPFESKTKLDAAYENTLKEQHTDREHRRTEAKRLEDITQENNMLNLETQIATGRITGVDGLNKFKESNHISSTDYHVALTMLNQRESIASDPDTLLDLWTRMSSMRIEDLPEPSEIAQAVHHNRLNAKTGAVPLLQARHAALQHFKTEAESLYDKSAQEAEQILNTRMTITGIFDIDQEAQVKKSVIIKELRDRWRERRGSAENPMDWVEELYGRFVQSAVKSGKINWDVQAMRSILPQGVQSYNDIIQLRQNKKLSDREFRNAMKLFETISLVEREVSGEPQPVEVGKTPQAPEKPSKGGALGAPKGGKASKR